MSTQVADGRHWSFAVLALFALGLWYLAFIDTGLWQTGTPKDRLVGWVVCLGALGLAAWCGGRDLIGGLRWVAGRSWLARGFRIREMGNLQAIWLMLACMLFLLPQAGSAQSDASDAAGVWAAPGAEPGTWVALQSLRVRQRLPSQVVYQSDQGVTCPYLEGKTEVPPDAEQQCFDQGFPVRYLVIRNLAPHQQVLRVLAAPRGSTSYLELALPEGPFLPGHMGQVFVPMQPRVPLVCQYHAVAIGLEQDYWEGWIDFCRFQNFWEVGE